MTVKISYHYTGPEGVEPINLLDWVNTLPEPEQTEFKEAARHNNKYSAIKEAVGKLKIEYAPTLTHIWTTVEDADAGLPADPVWEKYHDRYLTENNIKLEIIKE
jgi:hypothetical protein